jgi:hypothetical protein
MAKKLKWEKKSDTVRIAILPASATSIPTAVRIIRETEGWRVDYCKMPWPWEAITEVPYKTIKRATEVAQNWADRQ